jgi:hypothetical protein
MDAHIIRLTETKMDLMEFHNKKNTNLFKKYLRESYQENDRLQGMCYLNMQALDSI